MSNLLRVKQLKSCPYISFKLLNFLCIINQIINIGVAIVLFLELRDHHPLYTFGYLGTGLSGAALSIFAFRIAS